MTAKKKNCEEGFRLLQTLSFRQYCLVMVQCDAMPSGYHYFSYLSLTCQA